MDKIFAQAAQGAPQPQQKPTDDASRNARQQQNASLASSSNPDGERKFPKGVVLGADGKPCRSCTSFADWASMTKAQVSTSKATQRPTTTRDATSSNAVENLQTPTLPADCPPDVDRLGNHTWTLLHSISASYPEVADSQQQNDMRQFLSLFGKLYPCWVCASDFREWLSKPGNTPRVEGREGLGRWMCEAHNEVNRKLGKERFDCRRWQERWRTGWRDGRCDF